MIIILNLILATLIFSMHDVDSLDKSLMVNDYVGETMQYNLKYGIFNIGVASVSCLEDQAGCGYIIKAEAQSSGLLKLIKDINYRFECCMDPATGLPNSAIMDLRDGNHTVYNKVVFDHYSRTDSSIINSQTTGEHIVPKNIHDVLTGYYHFRQNLLNESINNELPVVIQTFLSDMIWDLRMTYTGGETINTMYGELSCLRFTSSTMVGRFFHNDDDMTVWFTKDEFHVPVKVRLNLKIGSL
ncbi:unnamed protein product, partial [marine sediment metagenome]